MSDARSRLQALAARLGISDGYWDIAGRERRTSDATRVSLLAAMGVDGSDEASAGRALEAFEDAERDALVDPILVWRAHAGRAPLVSLAAPAASAPLDYELELRLEDGAALRATGSIPAGATRPVPVSLPSLPPFGVHALCVRVAGAGVAPREGHQRLLVAPPTAFPARERIGDARVFGVWANLYAVRSARQLGVGDLGDLEALVRWCGAAGGAFVGLNPLHAVPNRGTAITPYSPSSRIYRNVLYLDVEAVPEWPRCPAAQARLRDPAFAAALAELRTADEIDHERVLDAKLALLRDLFATFRAERDAGPGERATAFAAWCAREGEPLRDFATWEALAEHLAAPPRRIDTDWRRWPERYRRPDTDAVAAFRREHAEAVELRAWLQFELARQLGAAAQAGREAGLAIGLYQDLAVGSAADSADAWLAPALFAQGAAVGAPPDDYAPDGQNWGFPPLIPHRLRADGYRFLGALLRANFADAGALRIDHAMGLQRLFWIPEGRSGSEGAYVHYPHDELFAVLALESWRARAVVIAEDLGTVPEGFRERLADWEVLSSSVLYFERDDATPRASSRISPRALATLETHDLVPLAGFASGADLRIRRRVGQIPDDAALADALAARRAEFEAWLERLRAEGCLPAEGEPDAPALAAAFHAFLARTPAALVGVALDDLAGESEPVNVPGIPVEAHRSWSRRMRTPLESLDAAPTTRAVLGALAGRARRRDESG